MEKSRNHLAFQQLKILGYPMRNIRQALPKLTGIQHKDVAKIAGVARETITQYLGGIGNNPKVKACIAEMYDIPVEELFDGSKTSIPH